MLSKRDQIVKYLDPLKIFWEDAEGNVHFSIVDALKRFDLEDTAANRLTVTKMACDLVTKANPEAQIVFRDKPDGPDYWKQKVP